MLGLDHIGHGNGAFESRFHWADLLHISRLIAICRIARNLLRTTNAGLQHLRDQQGQANC